MLKADLREADLSLANLLDATLSTANLEGAALVGSQMLRTHIHDAIFDSCNIHGISVWGAVGDPSRQEDLTITTSTEANTTVDQILLLIFRKILKIKISTTTY